MGEPSTADTELVTAHVGSRRFSSKGGEVFDYRFNEPFAVAFNFVLGFISSFFGTGGGFLRTPVLVNVFGFPVRVAVATSIFAMAFYATAGAATHAALGHIDWFPTFALVGAGLLVGSQIGAYAVTRTPRTAILRLLLALLLVLGVRLIVQGALG